MAYQIVYSSRETAPFTQESLTRLLMSSRKNNAQRFIIGALFYHKGSFLQILEGKRHQIEALTKIIQDDPRHMHFSIIKEKQVSKICFNKWSMSFVNPYKLPILSNMSEFTDLTSDQIGTLIDCCDLKQILQDFEMIAV